MSRPTTRTSASENSSLPADSVVNHLRSIGLEVHPWFYVPGRDLHAWITLNGPRPLTCLVPKPHQRDPGKRLESGQLDWEWSLKVDFEDPSHPWRGYIPLCDGWMRLGTQGWLFEPHDSARFLAKNSVQGALQLAQARKTNIQLTYRLVEFLCTTISQMYELQVPSEFYPPDAKWVHEEFTEERIICARVWEARRSILDLYGWVSYHLHRDLRPWHERDWRPGFVNLVRDRLRLLSAPRRGIIIDPSSISIGYVVKLVQDDIPIHYQWIPRGCIIRDPIIPNQAATRFDPYEFGCTHDYAAYKQACGKYSSTSMDRSKLGRKGTAALSKAYVYGRSRIFYIARAPAGEDADKKCPKKKIHYCVYDHDDAEYVEISKAAMRRLVDDSDGDVSVTETSSGTFNIFTPHEPQPLGSETTDLRDFFETLDGYPQRGQPLTEPASPMSSPNTSAQMIPESCRPPCEQHKSLPPPQPLQGAGKEFDAESGRPVPADPPDHPEPDSVSFQVGHAVSYVIIHHCSHKAGKKTFKWIFLGFQVQLNKCMSYLPRLFHFHLSNNLWWFLSLSH
jgi:hypothetical protein